MTAKIDVFNHILPAPFFARLREVTVDTGAGATSGATGAAGVNAGAGLTTISDSDVASPEPASLVAVIRHAIVRPRSAVVSV